MSIANSLTISGVFGSNTLFSSIPIDNGSQLTHKLSPQIWACQDVAVTSCGSSLTGDTMSSANKRSRKSSTSDTWDANASFMNGSMTLENIECRNNEKHEGLLDSYTKIWESFPEKSNCKYSRTPNLTHSMSPLCNISDTLYNL